MKMQKKYYFPLILVSLILVVSCSLYFKNTQRVFDSQKQNPVFFAEEDLSIETRSPNKKTNNANISLERSKREVKRSTSRQLKDADYIEMAIKALKKNKISIPEVKPTIDDSGEYVRVTWPVIRPEKIDGASPPGADYYYQILLRKNDGRLHLPIRVGGG